MFVEQCKGDGYDWAAMVGRDCKALNTWMGYADEQVARGKIIQPSGIEKKARWLSFLPLFDALLAAGSS